MSWIGTLGRKGELRGPGPMPPLLTISIAFLARDRGVLSVFESGWEAAEPLRADVVDAMLDDGYL